MYVPSSFAESDPAKLFEFIDAHGFGLLVSGDGEPFASHLPLLLDREAGPRGSLVGHMARANPQWRHAEGREVLAVFSGPHAYVSPTWYEAENVVPTWNYVAVHASGTFRAVEGDETVRIVRAAVEKYEATMPASWRFDAGSPFSRRLLEGVVAFRIEITRLEGKWKLGQNRTDADHAGALAGLRATNEPANLDLAVYMERSRPPAGQAL